MLWLPTFQPRDKCWDLNSGKTIWRIHWFIGPFVFWGGNSSSLLRLIYILDMDASFLSASVLASTAIWWLKMYLISRHGISSNISSDYGNLFFFLMKELQWAHDQRIYQLAINGIIRKLLVTYNRWGKSHKWAAKEIARRSHHLGLWWCCSRCGIYFRTMVIQWCFLFDS